MLSVLRLYFAFSGRIKRTEFWIGTCVMLLLLGLTDYWAYGTIYVRPAVLILSIWCLIAIQVKRWHDRGKTGLLVFINLIPMVGPLWSLIELGFLPSVEPSPTDKGAGQSQQRREKETRSGQSQQQSNAGPGRQSRKEAGGPPPLSDDLRHAQVLGLSGKVGRDEIKRRYRELVHKYHPDKVSHLGDEFKAMADQKFKAINEAYSYFRQKYQID
jgi:uncharacterized membrane protein YhaH (DUF805 family)